MTKDEENRSLMHLFEKILERDKDAFEAFYKQTSPRLYGIVNRLVENERTSRGIIKTIYLDIWEHKYRVADAKAGVLDWLIMTARIAALSKVMGRPSYVNNELRKNALPPTLPDSGHEVDFAGLTPAEMSLLKTAYLEAWSPKELSSAFGDSSENVLAKLVTCVQTTRGNHV